MSNIATENMETLSLFGIDEDWGIWLQKETENKEELKKEDRCQSGNSGRDSGVSSGSSEEGEVQEKAMQNRRLRALLMIQKAKLASSTRRGGDLVFTNGQKFFFNEKARNVSKNLGAPRPDDYEPPFYHKKKDVQKKKQEEEPREPSLIASLPEPQVPSLLSLDIPPPPPVFSHPPSPMVYNPVPPTFVNVPPPSFYHPAPVFPQMPYSSYPMAPCPAPYPQYPPHNYDYY